MVEGIQQEGNQYFRQRRTQQQHQLVQGRFLDAWKLKKVTQSVQSQLRCSVTQLHKQMYIHADACQQFHDIL